MPDSLPSLRFDNRTEFDALHFDTIDQNGVAFHVIVAKTAYRLGACAANGHAALAPLAPPAPLYAEDVHYGDDIGQSVRFESDLAPYKPHCDVIVVGSAHAPGGKPARRFGVRLHVQRASSPAPLPARPLPLNPMQPLSPAVHKEWQDALACARRTIVPGAVVIDKRLSISGERALRLHGAPLRATQSALAACSLGLLKLNRWRLTMATPVSSVPMRYEFAQGGQCMIAATDDAAKRVAPAHRLSAAEQTRYSHLPVAPAALDASQVNPLGRGFAPLWFLHATQADRLPAPQIDYAHARFSARQFWQNARGAQSLVPAGLGFVGRAWLPRRTLIGTVDMKADWGAEEVPALPADFDFAYWNGAPEDQQCAHLEGGEHVTLTNLCAPTAPFARLDSKADSVLSFILPMQSLFLLAADGDGAVAAIALAIDTVVIDTDAGQVQLTWRTCIVADGDFSDARLYHADDAGQLARLAELIGQQEAQPAADGARESRR